MKRVVNELINILAIACIIVLLYLFYPKVSNWLNGVSTDIQNSTFLNNEKFNLNNFRSLKGIGNLVNDDDVSSSMGYTGEDYDFDIDYYPYYGIISDEYKPLYKQIYANSLNLNNSFTPIVDINKDDVTNVIEAVMYDHPELFWLDNSYSYKYNSKNNCLQIILKFNETVNDFEYNKNLFEEKTNGIVILANGYSTDLEKIKFVHDKLVNMLNYDSNSKLNQSAYSALINNSSVCAGFSKAFQYIMIKLDIPCYYVTGDSGGDHAWNIVKINNNYYNIDITWDNTGGNIYAYYIKNDEDFSITHTRTGLSTQLPLCKANSYNVKNNSSTHKIKEKIDDEIHDLYGIEVEITP